MPKLLPLKALIDVPITFSKFLSCLLISSSAFVAEKDRLEQTNNKMIVLISNFQAQDSVINIYLWLLLTVS